MLKNSNAKAGEVRTIGWNPGSESQEKEMATHSSILAWRNSWTEEPGALHSIGSQRVRHDWSDLARMHGSIEGTFELTKRWNVIWANMWKIRC